MKNQCINELHRFDIRDHYWSVVSRTETDLRIHVLEDSNGWEFQGVPFTECFVTFRNYRLNRADWDAQEVSTALSFPEAMDHLCAEPLFVFSYGVVDNDCELCGVGSDGALSMSFSFDEVLIEWDYDPKDHVGELTIHRD